MTTTFLKVVCDIVLVCMFQEESFSEGLLSQLFTEMTE